MTGRGHRSGRSQSDGLLVHTVLYAVDCLDCLTVVPNVRPSSWVVGRGGGHRRVSSTPYSAILHSEPTTGLGSLVFLACAFKFGRPTPRPLLI